jgi:hypothetical protein
MAGATAAAMSPLAFAQAPAGQRILLGYDTYSIRSLRWKAPQVLEHAAGLKLDMVMMATPCFEKTDDAYLQGVDLERSIEYAKKTLDIGVRWRMQA